jgi:hypothetical protein
MSDASKLKATGKSFADEMHEALAYFDTPQPLAEPTLVELFDELAINKPAGSSKETTHDQVFVEDQPTHTLPAPTLYRVQHTRSFTHYDNDEGCFVAGGQYRVYPGHWTDPAKIRKHLNWHDQSAETPFISLFDNLGKPNLRLF